MSFGYYNNKATFTNTMVYTVIVAHKKQKKNIYNIPISMSKCLYKNLIKFDCGLLHTLHENTVLKKNCGLYKTF